MARSNRREKKRGPTPPPSARSSSRSPSLSDSEVVDHASVPSENPETLAPSASRSGSPMRLHPDTLESDESVTCQWEECGVVFTHLPTLIEHIHEVHVGTQKSNYSCEWASCPRRGLQQTSRFALVSHLRSHTGEKPFVCPECAKPFTRSDALAKHRRVQHNTSPPPPARGGSRKRKRPAEDDQAGPSAPPPPVPSPAPTNNAGAFNTFKVETPTPSEIVFEEPPPVAAASLPEPPQDDVTPRRPSHPPQQRSPDQSRAPTNGVHRSASPGLPPGGDEDEGYTSSSSDTLPAHLLPSLSPTTGLVLGRSPSMVMYLLMKAKHRYALEQHEELIEQLRVMKKEKEKEKELKEEALDQFLRVIAGREAEQLMFIAQPESGSHIPIAGPSSEGGGLPFEQSYLSSIPITSIPITNGNGR